MRRGKTIHMLSVRHIDIGGRAKIVSRAALYDGGVLYSAMNDRSIDQEIH